LRTITQILAFVDVAQRVNGLEANKPWRDGRGAPFFGSICRYVKTLAQLVCTGASSLDILAVCASLALIGAIVVGVF
jgi:hypothetical protein